MSNFLPPAELAKTFVNISKEKASNTTSKLIVLGILAGVFIGFAAHLATTVATGWTIGGAAALFGLKKFFVGAVFSCGLMLVIIPGSELFTGNNLMTIGLMNKDISFGQMMRNWGLVYFGNLIGSPISKNLIKIFFWTEAVKRENGTDKPDVQTIPVIKAAGLGAGVMGGGIAQLFASKKIPVRVKDLNYDAVSKAYQQAAQVLKGKLKRRRITKMEFNQILGNITGTTDYSGFKSVDFIVEAIVENLDVKKKVFSELENHISERAIVVSNTSSLRIDDMAIAFKHPQRFAGMHFFNPVHRMPLVEVIRGKQTSDETIATTFQLAKQLGKTPVVVGDGPGFLVNRLLMPYMVESISLIEEGHKIENLDRTMEKFGMPMGPIELFDEVGIDVSTKVAKILAETMGDRMAESDLLDKMVNDERLGKKNGLGFYRYEGKKRLSDPAISSYITIKDKTQLSETELIARMVYPMINEAARCLDEKIAFRPQDVDMGMIFGTGFAPFRGGLLNYADSEGISKIYDTLSTFAETYGDRFRPSAILEKVNNSGKGFYECFSG